MERLSSFLASLPSIDGEPSSPLAINVYSTLAKLHRHSLIPFLPRIMSSVLSSLSSSSQLHPACMQVVSALAMHTIDSSRDPVSNENTLRSLCRPLLSALLSLHPPHLSSGAASCLQSLVESSPWRFAPLDLQELVCAKGVQGLVDEGMQTVAHMDLMRALSNTSGCVVIQGYGAQLLSAGMDILQNSEISAKRVAAAQLLESVLKIADAELLDMDLSPIVGVLHECKEDEVTGVRIAVADALKTANASASYDRLPVSAVAEKRKRQRFRGLQCTAHTKSPASISTGGALARLPHLESTPSSINSGEKWLRRLPLAPLQQFSTANTISTAPRRKQTVPSRFSGCKENVAPEHGNGVPTGPQNTQPRRACFSKKDPPLLWPQSPSVTANVENWSLFDSPQTPIVPLRGDKEFSEKDASVTTLLEKHFGRQRFFWEHEIEASACHGSSNAVSFSRNEVSDQDEEHCNAAESCTSVENRESADRSSMASSLETDLCCGTEGVDSPDKETSSDCGSTIASAHVSNLQDQPLIGDWMMMPRKLVRTLQFDDECKTHLHQEMGIDFDGKTLEDINCTVAGSTQSDDNASSYDALDISSTPTECDSGSGGFLLSKEHIQGDINSIDSSSMVKQCIQCSRVSSVMQKAGTFQLTCSEMVSLKETACNDFDDDYRSFSRVHDVHGECIVPDVELKSSILSQQKHICSRLGGKILSFSAKGSEMVDQAEQVNTKSGT